MPTDRFLRLLDEKKQKITDAAVKEFARVPFEEVSINKIIKGAEISRGSFYTYFQDKDDLMDYLLEDIMESSLRHCKDVLIKQKGDLFQAVKQVYQDMIAAIKEKEQCNFYEHIISGIQTRRGAFVRNGGLSEQAQSKYLKDIDSFFDVTEKSNLKIDNKEDFRLFLEILTILLFKSLGKMLNEKMTEEESGEELKKSLELLKYGVYHRKAE